MTEEIARRIAEAEAILRDGRFAEPEKVRPFGDSFVEDSTKIVGET